jgi:hypothetical protein
MKTNVKGKRNMRTADQNREKAAVGAEAPHQSVQSAKLGKLISCECARRYVGPHSRRFQHLSKREALASMSPVEIETRRMAYAIKCIRKSREIDQAGREMALLITSERAVLIPIPSSNGTVEANLALCQAIQKAKPTVSIVPALRRIAPVESSCERGKAGLPRLSIAEHQMIRTGTPLPAGVPVYFVDNVIAEGNTLKAAWRCFKRGSGLMFADATP